MGRVSFFSLIKRYLKGLQPIKISVNNVILAPNEILKGKNAVVTGASSGIGKAIAKAYISAGAKVIAIGRNAEKLNSVKEEIGSDNYIPYPFDVSCVDKISDIIKDISGKFKNNQIDILVNCAGIKNGNDERFFQFTPEDFDEVLDINLKSYFFWCQKIAEYMISRNIQGHIVNVISIKGFIGEASPYSVSKWGCVSLTKGLGRMLAPKGIIVNGLAPGGTKTPMAKEHEKKWLHLATPSMRLADPNEMANIAVFLGSDLGNNIVGEVIISDGGQSLQYGNNRF